MNKQEALVKLAQVHMAINHVLRTRAMQKQAENKSFVNEALKSQLNPLNPDYYNTPVNNFLTGVHHGLDWSLDENYSHLTPIREGYAHYPSKLFRKLTNRQPYSAGFSIGDYMPGVENGILRMLSPEYNTSVLNAQKEQERAKNIGGDYTPSMRLPLSSTLRDIIPKIQGRR